MVFGYDARHAMLYKGADGDADRTIIDVLTEFYPQHQYFIYTTHAMENPRLTPLLARTAVQLKTPRHGLSRRWWMRSKGVLRDCRRHRVKLFHGLAGDLPIGIKGSTIGSVVSINTLQPVSRGPLAFASKAYHRFSQHRACHSADRVIVPTKVLKEALINAYGIAPDKVDVVPPCAEPRFDRVIKLSEQDDVRRKYGIPEEYVVIHAPINDDNHAADVVKAIEQLEGSRLALVLVGRSTAYYDKEVKRYAADHQLRGRVIHVPRAHTADLPSIYSRARAVLCLSAGSLDFPRSLVAAMQCGKYLRKKK